VNLLIVGGLFGVALLALILLAVVARGNGDRVSEGQEHGPAAGEKNERTLTVPGPREESGAEALASPTLPALRMQTEPDVPAERLPNELNGQLHELSAELHVLHQRARDFEQRINALSHSIERLERSRNSHIPAEADKE